MPIVTLSSDIGQQDYFAGAIKGQLLSHYPQLIITDISHYLANSNFPEAAYVCSNAYSYYPAQTIHLVFLSFFESKSDKVLIAPYKNQIIICPDNGILSMIAKEVPKEIYALDMVGTSTFLEKTEKIAVSVAAIFNGKQLSEIAKPTNNIIEMEWPQATSGDKWIRGQIIFIDNFENVVVNITKEEFESQRKGRTFKIVLARDEVIDSFSNNYLSVKEGEILAWFNSAGYMELAMNKGNIAGLFGLQGFNDIMVKEGKAMQNKWFYQTVTILFE